MGTIFDYLDWRGDIPFAQVPLNPVDALILSTLAYVHFQDLVPQRARSRRASGPGRPGFSLPSGIFYGGSGTV